MQSLYKYYDNVIASFVKNFDAVGFLFEFVETFNVNLIQFFMAQRKVMLCKRLT